ncbi:MAG: PTS sugar transporter subunit IIC [Myxococcota bacterium]|nr:PTS sugar transporter subunit IIC [Myxococcota bacterium]
MSFFGLAIDLSLVALLGALLALERRSAFQFMLSQPVFAVTLLGAAFGQLTTGLMVGVCLQLLWMSCVLFGANTPRNETLAAITIGGAIVLYQRYVGPAEATMNLELVCLAIAIGAPSAFIGQQLDIRLDTMNRSLALQADALVERGEGLRIGRYVWLAMFRTALTHFVASALTTAVTFILLMQGMIYLSVELREALFALGAYIVPALGLAVTLAMIRRRAGLVIAASTFVVVFTAIMGHGVAQ